MGGPSFDVLGAIGETDGFDIEDLGHLTDDDIDALCTEDEG